MKTASLRRRLWRIQAVIFALLFFTSVLPWLVASVQVEIAFRRLSERQNTDASALKNFEELQQSYPRDLRTYRGIANLLARQGNINGAIAQLNLAYQLHPADKLVTRLLATAYDSGEFYAEANGLWQQLAETPDWMIDRGDHEWLDRHFPKAIVWYQRSLKSVAAMSDGLAFRVLVASIIEENGNTQDLTSWAEKIGIVVPLVRQNGTTLIPGGDFHWMDPMPEFGIESGTLLSFPGGSEFGTLWWQGEAVSIVNIVDSGQYELSAMLFNSTPPPISVQIGIDGQDFIPASLTKGDMTPETISRVVSLAKGLHTIQVRYENDAVLQGLDRNAIIEKFLIRGEE